MESQGPPAGRGQPGCSFFSVQPPRPELEGAPAIFCQRPQVTPRQPQGLQAHKCQGTEDTDSGFLSICANRTVEVCPLRCENPLDSDGATPMPQNGAETSLPSCWKSLSYFIPNDNFLLQNKVELGYSQLIYSIRKAVFSQGFTRLPVWEPPTDAQGPDASDTHAYRCSGRLSTGFCR